MAKPAVQNVCTMSQMKDAAGKMPDGSPDIRRRTEIGAAKKASVLVINTHEGEQVRYIYDGRDLWHRVDTKAAKVLRRTAKRQVVGRG